MSNELVEVGDASASLTTNSFDMVDVESAKAFMDNYQELCKALLDKSDYQNIQTKEGIKSLKKKSAWRKIATAFNLSDEIIEKEIIRDDNYQIISATFQVKVIAPNGRSGIGTASCSIFDKIKKSDKSQPSNFELRKRFTNAENDVIGTAHTRAKSRAIGDLVGMGEVSAEELEEMEIIPKTKAVKATPKSKVVNAKAKPKSKPKTKKEPSKDDEAIEVEIVGEGKSKSLKELMEENKHIKRVVEQLNDEDRIINLDSVKDRLLTLVEAGTLSQEDYENAKQLME